MKPSYVVITRPEPGLSETVRKVEELGWLPYALPLTQIKTLKTDVFFLEGIQAILFTSRQAIYSLCESLSSHNMIYHHVPVFTVGDITAREAQKAGFMEVISAHKDAEALGMLIQKTLSPLRGKLFLPSGKGQGGSLISVLNRAGFDIIHQEIYESLSVQDFHPEFIDRLRKNEIHTILFFSSQAARFFIQLFPPDLLPWLKGIQAIGMSVKVESVLKELDWKTIKTAKVPTTDSVIDLL